MRTDRLRLAQRGQVLVQAASGSFRVGRVAGGDEVAGEPGEDVADAGLAGFVAVQAADDAAALNSPDAVESFRLEWLGRKQGPAIPGEMTQQIGRAHV